MLTRLPFQSAGAVKLLRYQPVPLGKKPPPAPLGASLSGLLSMLQSWGRSTVRHEASANVGASAPAGSPRKNFQPASAASSWRGAEGCVALMEMGAREAATARSAIRRRGGSFIGVSFRGCFWRLSRALQDGGRPEFPGRAGRAEEC